MDNIRVLFVSHSSELYGAERSLLIMVQRLLIAGDIKPVVLVPEEGLLAERLRRSDVPVMVAHYYHWLGRCRTDRLLKGRLRIILNLLEVFRISGKVKALKPSIVFSNTLASPFGALLAAKLNLPHIWHIREFVHEDMGREFDVGMSRAVKWINRSVKIVCNSHAVLNKWNRYLVNSGSHFCVVYNGFDFDEQENGNAVEKYDWQMNGRNPLHLVIIGSILPRKGHEDAIRAVADLERMGGPSVQLIIVGGGEEKYIRFLKVLAKDLGVSDKIEWKGFQENVNSYFQEAIAALVCSRHEPFGRVAVEAMAAGVPVVSTRSGGLPEIIEDGQSGLLYDVEDHAALARAIRRLLLNRDLYLRISETAKARVRTRFTVEHYVDRMEQIIKEAYMAGCNSRMA